MSSHTPSHPHAKLTEIVLPGVVEPDGLVVRERPIPTPGEGQALVEMQATGVSFGEQGMRRNRYPGQPKFPFKLGYDLVGVVTAVGPKVDPGLVGRRVAAVTKIGGWTTHALLEARTLVPIPGGVDAAEAETVVLNGITAWQMLHRKAASSGDRRSSSTAQTAASARRWCSSPATPGSASSRPPRPATTTRCASWAPSRSTTTTRNGSPRPRARARRRRRRLRPPRRPELRAVVRPAGAGRDARGLRHGEPARRH